MRKVHTTFLYMRICKYQNQGVRTRQKENLSRVFQKQKRERAHEDTEIHKSIQDLVFTTIYQL